MERKRGYEVSQTLGQRIEVDTSSKIHLFWGRDGEEEVEHVFSDIAPAIRQQQHVIEGWLGLEEEIRGHLLAIPGEAQEIEGLVKETMGIARRFLGPQPLTRRERENIRRQLEDLIGRIGAVRNAHKVAFKHGLEAAYPQTVVDAATDVAPAKPQVAAEVYRAAEAGLARLQEIARKVAGVGIRLQILLGEEERARQVIKATYESLHRLLVRLKDNRLTPKDLERIAKQVCGEGANLINGLESIWVPPYGLRVRSREVQRLRKMGEYAAAGNQQQMVNALTGAFLKLRSVVKELQDRHSPKAKRWIPH